MDTVNSMEQQLGIRFSAKQEHLQVQATNDSLKEYKLTPLHLLA